MTWAVPILLPEWRVTMTSRGRAATDPRGTGELHYAEGLPPAELDALLSAEMARWAHLEPKPRTTPEHLVTDEGEYAALAVFDGLRDGKAVVLAVGVVLGDEPAAVLVSVADEPGLVDTTRSLLLKDTQSRGVRRRRFRHRAPDGWRAERSGFDVHYLLGTGRAQITVLPAMPAEGAREPRSLALELGATGALQDERTASLYGVSWTVTVGEVERTVVLLGDSRFTYSVRLDAPPGDGEAQAALRALVESIEPVPAPQGDRIGQAGVASHWLE